MLCIVHDALCVMQYNGMIERQLLPLSFSIQQVHSFHLLYHSLQRLPFILLLDEDRDGL